MLHKIPTAVIEAPAARRRVALMDPASFVLPFDFYLVNALEAEGVAVDFYCSRTTANAELVGRLRAAGRISVYEYPVSSTVSGRVRGVLSYARMCRDVVARYEQYDAVILQYSILPLLELSFLRPVRRKLWLQIHDEAGLAERARTPILLNVLKAMAQRLLFASPAVMEAHARSHPRTRRPSSIARHGVLPVFPEDLRIAVNAQVPPENVLAFWGLVKPYKGVDLFARLARSGMFKEFALEVHGKWHSSAQQDRRALVQGGVAVDDAFLPPDALRRLLLRPLVFVLPYRSASQSGVLYTLLNYGCVFISTDVGDNGRFLREHGLADLLFDREDLDSVHSAARFAFDHFADLRERLLKIRHEFDWTEAARAIARCLEAQRG